MCKSVRCVHKRLKVRIGMVAMVTRGEIIIDRTTRDVRSWGRGRVLNQRSTFPYLHSAPCANIGRNLACAEKKQKNTAHALACTCTRVFFRAKPTASTYTNMCVPALFVFAMRRCGYL